MIVIPFFNIELEEIPYLFIILGFMILILAPVVFYAQPDKAKMLLPFELRDAVVLGMSSVFIGLISFLVMSKLYPQNNTKDTALTLNSKHNSSYTQQSKGGVS